MTYRADVKARWIVGVVAALAAARSCGTCGACRPHRDALVFATFNIEDFPKSDRQIAGAFDEIARTGASFVAVQEIVEPALFAREARARLGDDWEFVATSLGDRAQPFHELGVLYDRRVWTLAGTAVHDDTRLDTGRGKPVFEAQLQHDGTLVRVFVVHLKAGGDGREIRAQQYAALARMIARTTRSADRVVVLGDFNATDDTGDRADLSVLAATTDLVWASEPLACSAFWDRDDGCFRSRLDHVVMWTRPARIVAAGACATEGCDRQDRCPVYTQDVSDHCPVVVTVE
jgi:endonuclease/exonuclease/phosphatase family metal-dependent hydrolase